jgi:hypothetical protein
MFAPESARLVTKDNRSLRLSTNPPATPARSEHKTSAKRPTPVKNAGSV